MPSLEVAFNVHFTSWGEKSFCIVPEIVNVEGSKCKYFDREAKSTLILSSSYANTCDGITYEKSSPIVAFSWPISAAITSDLKARWRLYCA